MLAAHRPHCARQAHSRYTPETVLAPDRMAFSTVRSFSPLQTQMNMGLRISTPRRRRLYLLVRVSCNSMAQGATERRGSEAGMFAWMGLKPATLLKALEALADARRPAEPERRREPVPQAREAAHPNGGAPG